MFMYLRIAIAAGVLAVVSLASRAAGEVQKNALRIITFDVAPFGMRDASGRPAGNVLDIGGLIAAERGLDYVNTLVPYARAAALIESGDAYVLITLPSARLKSVATPIVTVNTVDVVVVGKAGLPIHSLEDLHGKTVTVMRSAEYDQRLTKDREIRKYLANDYEQGVKMLLGDRLDAIVGMKEGIWFALKESGSGRSTLGEPFVLNRQTA